MLLIKVLKCQVELVRLTAVCRLHLYLSCKLSSFASNKYLDGNCFILKSCYLTFNWGNKQIEATRQIKAATLVPWLAMSLISPKDIQSVPSGLKMQKKCPSLFSITEKLLELLYTFNVLPLMYCSFPQECPHCHQHDTAWVSGLFELINQDVIFPVHTITNVQLVSRPPTNFCILILTNLMTVNTVSSFFCDKGGLSLWRHWTAHRPAALSWILLSAFKHVHKTIVFSR